MAETEFEGNAERLGCKRGPVGGRGMVGAKVMDRCGLGSTGEGCSGGGRIAMVGRKEQMVCRNQYGRMCRSTNDADNLEDLQKSGCFKVFIALIFIVIFPQVLQL